MITISPFYSLPELQEREKERKKEREKETESGVSESERATERERVMKYEADKI